ncbi:HlyD family type I secretion periplasmic adaptor subunit [Buttiauxella sp. B2]|uniref:HlyD family type I secretion periplasmic adaptor subunit n=1 Tax=Buttiauxella sp. B2 TaxID=2587812 RepID=UPI00112477B0|nr:HlyD family type I secretion periplasmic adaptor subunit [Buttiauxella sp. B2]TNV11864.1 HlyD family type I secretion periplasmic adaptor subunit [Buttiauxella sp. B2]
MKLSKKKNDDVISAEDAAFMNDVRESLLSQTTPGSKIVLYLIFTIFAGGLIWAHFARVEEITQGDAKVISKSREQVIQSLEGGILEKMSVSEGQVVEKDEILLRLDPTRSNSNYKETLSKVVGLQGSIDRLTAEAYNKPLSFRKSVTDPEVIRQETQAYKSRKHDLDSGIKALQHSYDLTAKEVNLALPLVKQGLMSEVELLRTRRQATDLQSQIVEKENKFRADANSQLTNLQLELSQAQETLIGRKDILNRTVIRAPVKGTIKDIKFNTLGGVIQPGEHIMSIVPLEDQLLVEAKVKPADVAFLRPGLPATVKITAYDFSIYGGLKGVVQQISPGTIKDEQQQAKGRPDDTYYQVMVLTNSSSLHVKDKVLPIIPGMIAKVEIKTGEKTILDYLLKPIFKAREAFRER